MNNQQKNNSTKLERLSKNLLQKPFQNLNHLDISYAYSLEVWHIAIKCFLEDNPMFKKYGIPQLPQPPKYKNPLKLFCYLITYQAIHNKVCDKIWDRFVKLVNKRMVEYEVFNTNIWKAEFLLSFTDEELYGKNGVG